MIKAKCSTSLYIIIFIVYVLSSCSRRVADDSAVYGAGQALGTEGSVAAAIKPQPLFPQIHTNLNGMVTEFVRSMHQDTKGNYWFGSNTNGIIRYDGQALEKVAPGEDLKWFSVREIREDKEGNVWFGTSSGLIKYDGQAFTVYSRNDGLLSEEIWGLYIDSTGMIWVGTLDGVFQFDGTKFTPFALPETMVENPDHMLSDKLVMEFLQDRNGTMWFVMDANGIFTYTKGKFTHLTNKNGLTDNSVADILQDRKGNIWIGTFYGGMSKYHNGNYVNFTKDGVIEGIETYNLLEDRQGNVWFSAEHYGVYKYDGAVFTQFTTQDGLASNGVQNIYEDIKGQIWFSTWHGMSLYDGEKIMDAVEAEPWTN